MALVDHLNGQRDNGVGLFGAGAKDTVSVNNDIMQPVVQCLLRSACVLSLWLVRVGHGVSLY